MPLWLNDDEHYGHDISPPLFMRQSSAESGELRLRKKTASPQNARKFSVNNETQIVIE